MSHAAVGVIGLGVMGSNLALNIADRGFEVAVWNRTPETAAKFVADHPEQRLSWSRTLEEFVAGLARPRRVLMMVAAGSPVDQTLLGLRCLLEPGDIVIDGGNTWFKDTQRREADLRAVGLRFVGMGVSGGEEGARHGPALMPGGDPAAWEPLRPMLEAIAAKTEAGACVGWIGTDGAGHFVKMVHNGIEYGDMQLIAEAYDLLRTGLGLAADEIADIFQEWNRGPLESFLIELTAAVLRVKDSETARPLVDLVLDRAGQKGTGKWTVQIALELGVPVPTLAAAVDARGLSGLKEERVTASQRIRGPQAGRWEGNRTPLIEAVRDALHAAKIVSYAQGMALIGAASATWSWNIRREELARIWKGGCIIRARLLDAIARAFRRDPAQRNLLLDDEIRLVVEAAQTNWRRAVTTAQMVGVPVPALSASLAYFDSYRTARLPQNLTQAQRDAFGAHTYERIDHPERGAVHTEWLRP